MPLHRVLARRAMPAFLVAALGAPAAAQLPAAADTTIAATHRGARIAIGYAGNLPRQPFGGAVLLLRGGFGLYADARTTVPDPGWSKEVPVVSADTIIAAPGHRKEFRNVYASWAAGVTWTRERWGAYVAGGKMRRRVYLQVPDDAGLFSETGQIWGEDHSRRVTRWAYQAGIIRELAPGAFVFVGGQSVPGGATLGFALALNGR